MKKTISVVIPAYNEEDRIHETLIKLNKFIETNNVFNFEVLVVNDGSKDKTSQKVNEFKQFNLIELEKNSGKGAAVRQGVLASNGDYILFTDADFSTPITEIEKLISKIENGYDIAIGSRAINSDLIKEHQPFYRELMGKTFNKIVQFLVVKGIQDTQCGFKLFKSNVGKEIFSKSKINGYSFDVEVIYIASKLNYKIAEVSVLWYNDDRSKVDPIKDSIKMFKEILKIKSLHKF